MTELNSAARASELEGSRIDQGDLRGRFALDPAIIYANAANFCPTFRHVLDAEHAAARAVQAQPAIEVRAAFAGLARTTRARIASLLGAVPEAIALTRNCSQSNGEVLRGLDLRPGDEVVLGRENHESNLHGWRRRAGRDGFIVKIADTPATPQTGQEIVDAYLAAVTPRTRVIALSHMSNVAGLITPIAPLADYARQHGVWLHVDAAQTFGWMPLDVVALGVDSLSASNHKWLLGPVEGGVLYVRPDRIGELTPLVESVGYWREPGAAIENTAQAFELLGQREDAKLAGLEAALNAREAIGEAEISRRVLTLCASLRERLSTRGLAVAGSSDSDLWGPVLAVEAAGSVERQAQFWNRHRIACARTRIGEKPAIRLAVHIYNTEADLERLVGVLADPSA